MAASIYVVDCGASRGSRGSCSVICKAASTYRRIAAKGDFGRYLVDQVISPVISGISRVNPLITGDITYLRFVG